MGSGGTAVWEARRAGDHPRLSLIRGFRLSVGGGSVDLPRNAQRVLAYLALHEAAVLREHLAQCLWLDMSEERAAANLRTALWRINRLGLPLVASRLGDIELAPTVLVDVRIVTDRAAQLLHPSAATESLDLSVGELVADLLPGWYEDWVLVEQERFRQLRLHALEAICVRLTHEHRFPDAVQAGIAAVACEPLRETSQAALMKAFIAEGNVVEAVRQYGSYRAQLQEALGIEPGSAIRSLIPADQLPGRGPTVFSSPASGTASRGVSVISPTSAVRVDATRDARETATGEDRPRTAEPLGATRR